MANDNFDLPRPTDPVPSSTSAVINDDAKVLDYVVNSTGTVVTRTGKTLLTLDEALNKFGFGIADFTFTTGGTLTSLNLLVSNSPVDGFLYKYVGPSDAPIVVTAGTDPTAGSDWQAFSATDHSLLSNINAAGGHDAIYARNFKTVSDLKSGIDATGQSIDMSLLVGFKVFWRGYYAESDGGSNWGIVRIGAHVGDDGSIISIDANTYVEANFGGSILVNIKKFGARESNTALQNNDSINKAMAIAAANRTQIRIPKGRFETGQHKGISNSGIVGYGRESVLLRNRGLSDFGALLFIEGGSANPEDNIKDYIIKDVSFEGFVETEGFSEFKHLILAQGVSNLTIKRVYFKGFQGDALSIRSGNNAYQNDTIRVSASEFDGVNKNNRNAISCNDCVGFWITGSVFKNCTRDGDPSYVQGQPYDVMDQSSGPGQPGAIDLEPNTQDVYIRLKNIRIHDNQFNQIGGNVGCVAMFLPVPYQNFTNGYPYDISVQDNHMTNVFRAFHFTNLQTADIGDDAPSINLKILNNTARFISDRPFWIYGLRGARMEGNFYRNAAEAARIGWSDANRGVSDIQIRKDRFKYCGTSGGQVLNIYNAKDVTIERTNFDDCGVTSGGFGIAINVIGNVSRLKLVRNEIVNLLGRTTGAVNVTGTIVKGGNESFDNEWAGLDASTFVPDLTQYGESTIQTVIVAKAGGGQSLAVQLVDSVNILTTVVSVGDSVKLPAANRLGRLVTVINHGASSAAIFPKEGDNLGNGINVSETLASGDSYTYKSYDSVNWVRIY